MPHPRPTGDTQALSSLLRASTAEIHKEAEQRPFMRAFFAGVLPRDAYIGWLARQWHLYRTIEAALDALRADRPDRGLVPRVLYRTDRIEGDLDHLTGCSWRNDGHLTPATRQYVERIEGARGLPAGIVAHAWLRYMGNVGGRDTLRRLVAASIGADETDVAGLAFTDFSAVGEIRPFFADFHARLDALPLTDAEKAAAVGEADAGFRLNIALTDELADDFRIHADDVGAARHETRATPIAAADSASDRQREVEARGEQLPRLGQGDEVTGEARERGEGSQPSNTEDCERRRPDVRQEPQEQRAGDVHGEDSVGQPARPVPPAAQLDADERARRRGESEEDDRDHGRPSSGSAMARTRRNIAAPATTPAMARTTDVVP